MSVSQLATPYCRGEEFIRSSRYMQGIKKVCYKCICSFFRCTMYLSICQLKMAAAAAITASTRPPRWEPERCEPS